MEGASQIPPTLAHQFIKQFHSNFATPSYVSTENNFVPLSPELRVKPLDVVLSDNGLTLRDICLRRLRDQSKRRRKVINEKSMIKTQMGDLQQEEQEIIQVKVSEQPASQDQNQQQQIVSPRFQQVTRQLSKRPTLKLNNVDPGEIEISAEQEEKERKKKRILKETVRRYAAAKSNNNNIIEDSANSNCIPAPILKIKQLETPLPHEQLNIGMRNIQRSEYLTTQNNKTLQSSLMNSHRRESIKIATSSSVPLTHDVNQSPQVYHYINQLPQQQISHYSSVLAGEHTLFRDNKPLSQIVSPKGEPAFSSVLTERKNLIDNSTLMKNPIPSGGLSSVLSDSLIPGGIPKQVLLPSINIKRLLDKFEENKKNHRQRNHTVVNSGVLSASSKQNTQRIDTSLMISDKNQVEGRQQGFSVSYLKEQIMTSLQVAKQIEKSRHRKQSFSLIPANVLPSQSPENHLRMLQGSPKPLITQTLIPQSPQIGKLESSLLLPSNANEFRRASMNYNKGFPPSQFRLNPIKSKQRELNQKDEEEYNTSDVESLKSSKKDDQNESSEEGNSKNEDLKQKRMRRGTHNQGYIEKNLPLVVKKFGKFRSELNIANDRNGQVEDKKQNSILQQQNEISPDMKTTQISPFRPEDYGQGNVGGRQLDQIPERIYDSDSSGYSCTISSLMGGGLQDGKDDYDNQYEINNDYSIFLQRGKAHRFPSKMEKHNNQDQQKPILPQRTVIPHQQPIMQNEESLLKTSTGRLPRVKVELKSMGNGSANFSPRKMSLGREDIVRQREHIRKIIEEEVMLQKK